MQTKTFPKYPKFIKGWHQSKTSSKTRKNIKGWLTIEPGAVKRVPGAIAAVGWPGKGNSLSGWPSLPSPLASERL